MTPEDQTQPGQDPDAGTADRAPAAGTERADQASAQDVPDNLEDLLRQALAPTYLLGERIDEGGMGTVYLARDPVLKRSVAVKILSPDLAKDVEPRERFIREAQAAARLAHPNVIPVYAVGELSNGLPYFVMRHVPGGSMADRLAREGPLALAEARRVIGSVAAGLEAAHANGIVHRDVKPGNVLHDPDTDQVLVTDFGISAILEREEEPDLARLTRTGVSLGSPLYMSPEQCIGAEVSPASDVYGLGLLAYELLTGSPPFPGETPQELIAAHLRDTPSPLSEVRTEVDPELEQLVAACLRKEPAERPDAREIVRRLLPERGALLEWPPPGLEPLGPGVRQAMRAIGAGGALWTGALVLMSARWLEDFQVDPETLGLAGVFLGLLGLLALAAAVRGFFVVGRGLSRSAALGYGWGTLLDVLADDHHDTGALIGGTLEYAELTPGKRARFRRRRRAGFLLQLVASLCPLPSMLVYVAASSQSAVSPAALALAAVLPTTALFLIALLMELQETLVLWQARRRIRRRRRAPEKAVDSLLASWHDALRLASRGQSLSAGPEGKPQLGIVAASAIIAVLTAAIFLILPILFVGAYSSLQRAEGVWWPARTQEYWARAQVSRSLVLQPDSSLSSSEASALAWGLLWRESDEGQFRRPDPSRLPPPLPESVSRVLVTGEGSFGVPYEEYADSLMTMGARGFTPEQTRWIEEVTGHPRLQVFSTIARAPTLDLFTERHFLPLDESMTVWDLPIPGTARLRGLGYLKHFRAALLLSRGDTEGAERELREVISVGFLLGQQPLLIENLIGAFMIARGQRALIELYRLTGRSRDAERMEAAERSARPDAAGQEISIRLGGPGRADWLAQAAIRDPSSPPGQRWELLLQSTMFEPCASPASLISGISRSWQETAEIARREMIRTPGERELFRLVDEWYLRVRHQLPDTWWARLLYTWSAAAGRILGNERIPGCMALDLSLLAR